MRTHLMTSEEAHVQRLSLVAQHAVLLLITISLQRALIASQVGALAGKCRHVT